MRRAISYDSLKRVVEINPEGIYTDYFSGYTIFENIENINRVSILFKDLDRKFSEMKRSFIIDRRYIPIIKSLNKNVENDALTSFRILTHLKNSTKEKEIQDVYNDNYHFFVAYNMSYMEWLSFCQ